MADYRVAGADLVSVADAIRTKGGTSAQLVFPGGFVDAIGDIPTGQQPVLVTKTITENGTYTASSDNADGYSSVTVNLQDVSYESGTFTCPSTGTSYTLNFSNSYSKYAILIEATTESKSEILNTGATAAKTFGIFGVFPKPSINNVEVDTNTVLLKVTPSTGVTSSGVINTFTYTGSSITCPLSSVSYANYLYNGLSYNYHIVEIK